ncbi:MAG: ATP-binding protein [Acidobacteria bacterium]|nr:ATP-binding protein [Acidobacteriota bacterium]
MPPFIGRRREFQLLQSHLHGIARTGVGRLLSVRGRRQVGKSRLVSELVKRSGLPSLYFTASRQSRVEADLERFAADAAERSTLPGREVFASLAPNNWDGALRLLGQTLPANPSIVVLDELPWLVEHDPGLEGTIHKLWDTLFEGLPVLFILIGSDLSMMEALTSHGRPLFGRAREIVVSPFHIADTAEMLGSEDPAAAFDAQLVTGGYPRLLLDWRRGQTLWSFLGDSLADENTSLVTTGSRILAAEFPVEVQAHLVLRAVGAGRRTFGALREATGLQPSPLSRSLDTLRTDKRVIAVERPLSLRPSRDTRYSVQDPYLRFWLRLVEPGIADISRGRPDLALTRVRREWPAYRGLAVESLVREAVLRLAAGDERLRGAASVGGYWTRRGDVEVDLVGADRAPPARRILFVGSIKWRERSPFDRRDLAALAGARARIPGASQAALIAVARAGVGAREVDAAYGPSDLLGAWT